MARKSSNTDRWVIALLVAGAIVLVVAALVMNANPSPEPAPTPTRAVVLTPQATEEASAGTPTPSPTPEQATPLAIPASLIEKVTVPAIALDIAVSGETLPRQTENCHGATLCIDPPVPDQAAWYGATPAVPSVGSVRLFGHTSWTKPEYAAFNDVLAMKDGDEIIVTTQAGVFTYRASAPQLVPYTEVAQSQLIWGNAGDRLVLITCNSAESSGTIVEAWLVKAVPR